MTASNAERLLAEDLGALDVLVGVRRGWWTIDRIKGTELTVTFAVPAKLFAPASLTLAIDCTDYPAAPTGRPIDPESRELLPADRRPTHGRCAMTFRCDWENGTALYLAVDRVALAGHPDWPQTHPHDVWDPAKGIAQFLRIVRRDLVGDHHECTLVAA